jgi:hypothetical protein
MPRRQIADDFLLERCAPVELGQRKLDVQHLDAAERRSRTAKHLQFEALNIEL